MNTRWTRTRGLNGGPRPVEPETARNSPTLYRNSQKACFSTIVSGAAILLLMEPPSSLCQSLYREGGCRGWAISGESRLIRSFVPGANDRIITTEPVVAPVSEVWMPRTMFKLEANLSSVPVENEFVFGYPTTICDVAPGEKYLCCSCKNVLKKAQQTLCGHRYCTPCLVWIVSRNHDLCPKCKAEDPTTLSDDSLLKEERVENLRCTLAMKDIVLNELEMRSACLEQTSYDGVFLWKISDLTNKSHDAVTGRAISLYSPAFYTAKYGYKVCLRIYLNGDGAGKGTHVSLFFTVMKGEYDALLPWPFKHKVTFVLVDHNNRDSVFDAFRPDVTSASFQRPINDMNVASGCPLFCPIAKLNSPKHAYIRENTLYIRCIIDTNS
uniref:TNF receptor-associated factor n=1 Tax=Xenopus tropicalis TaxID=8364 RepID=A0A1B8YA66_XENTR